MNRVLAAPIAELLTRLLGTRGTQRLSILIYHRVLTERDYMRPTEPTAVEFDIQMELLARHCNPLPLFDAIKMLDSDQLPERAVCVTFDDGYADNETVALPFLRKWGIPATVFVATGFVNGGQMWNDTIIESIRSCDERTIDLTSLGLERYSLDTPDYRRSAAQKILRSIKHWEPEKRQEAVNYISSFVGLSSQALMLDDFRLKNLHSHKIEIGAHTVNHPILSALHSDEAACEIESSKSWLEEKLGSPIRFFAYPNGVPDRDYLPIHRDMVREMGFSAALSTHWGVASKESDRWQLPRFTPWDRTPLRFLARLLINRRRLA